MIVIFGGAFSGKLEFAMEEYNLTTSDVHVCSNLEIHHSKQIIYKCHELVFELVKQNINAVDYFKQNLEVLENKILIFDDISCGVVSIDPLIRKFREENGRVMTYLCKEATDVTRVFCAIATKLK